MGKNSPRRAVASILIVFAFLVGSISAVGTVTPNDAHWGDSWPLVRINADDAWDLDDQDQYTNAGAQSVVVAVIDTGLYWDEDPNLRHPDFDEDLIWTNPNEAVGDANGDNAPGLANVDDDGDGLVDEDREGREPGDAGYDTSYWADDDENGYIDDLHGWDFYYDDASIYHEVGTNRHGTRITSIVSATVNNFIGISGIAPDVKIMVLKKHGFDNNPAFNTMQRYIMSVEYAVANGADVILFSSGLSHDSTSDDWPNGGAFDDAFEAAVDAGVFICCASGNDGETEDRIDYPSSSEFVMAVGSLNNANPETRSSYSSWTSIHPPNEDPHMHHVEVVAPTGEDDPLDGIWVCYELSGANTYLETSATSEASPQVAAAAALMLSYNPSLTPEEVRSIIRNTADDVVATGDGWDAQTGYGCLNIERAVRTAVEMKPELKTAEEYVSANLWHSSDPGGDPSIDVDRNGYVHVAFLEEYGDPGNEVVEVCYMQLSPNGEVMIPTTRIEAGQGCVFTQSLDPCIEVAHDDEVAIVWSEIAVGGGRDIMFAKFKPDDGAMTGLQFRQLTAAQLAIWYGANAPVYDLNLVGDASNPPVEYYIVFRRVSMKPPLNGEEAVHFVKLSFPGGAFTNFHTEGAVGFDYQHPSVDIYDTSAQPGNMERIVMVCERHDQTTQRHGLYVVSGRVGGGWVNEFSRTYMPVDNREYRDPDIDVDYGTGQICIVFRETVPLAPNNGDLMYFSIQYDPGTQQVNWLSYTDSFMTISDADSLGTNYFHPRIAINDRNEVRVVFDHTDGVWSFALTRDGRSLGIQMMDVRDPNQNFAWPQVVAADIHLNPTYWTPNRAVGPFDEDGHFWSLHFHLAVSANPELWVTSTKTLGSQNYLRRSDVSDVAPDIDTDDLGGNHVVWVEQYSGYSRVYYDFYKPSLTVGKDTPTVSRLRIDFGYHQTQQVQVSVHTILTGNVEYICANIAWDQYTTSNPKGDLYWAQMRFTPSNWVWTKNNHGEVAGSSSHDKGFHNLRIQGFTDLAVKPLFPSTTKEREYCFFTWHDDDDDVWFAAVNIDNSLTGWRKYKEITTDGNNPEIDVDSLGNVYIVYERDDRARLARWDFSGSDFSSNYELEVALPLNRPGIQVSKPKIELDRDFDRNIQDPFVSNRLRNHRNNELRGVHILYDGSEMRGGNTEHMLYYVKYRSDSIPLCRAREVFPPYFNSANHEYEYYSSDTIDARMKASYDNEIAFVFSSVIETGVVDSALGYTWHTIDEVAHLWFGMLTGNGEVYTTATFVNTDYSEDCVYGELSYTDGTFDVVFLQENGDDLDLKTLWMTI